MSDPASDWTPALRRRRHVLDLQQPDAARALQWRVSVSGFQVHGDDASRHVMVKNLEVWMDFGVLEG